MNTEGLSNPELARRPAGRRRGCSRGSACCRGPAPPHRRLWWCHNLDDSSLYIHRELSQMQFNIRVLEQALDESYPLLERLKFLLIFSSNLDEFFEIRVAGLKKQITFAREQAAADGLQPHQALARIAELAHEQVERQYAILNDNLFPALAKHNVNFIRRRFWTAKTQGLGAALFPRRDRADHHPDRPRSDASVPVAGEQEPELYRRAGGGRCLWS